MRRVFSKGIDVRVDREFRDIEGRILVLLVNLSGHRVILGNIYAPNEEDSSFSLSKKLSWILETSQSYQEATLINLWTLF